MIWQSILCSIDSFFAALVLGMLGAGAARSRTKLVFCFAGFEVLGSLLGAKLHNWVPPWASVLDSFLLALLLVAAAGILLLNCHQTVRIFVVLPLLLSLDNVIAYVNYVEQSRLPQALLLSAACSGVLALGGLWIGQLLGIPAGLHFVRLRRYFAMVSAVFFADVFS